MTRRAYAILGTGGLGGFYGCELHRAGQPVHFLMRSDYQRARERGLTYETRGRSCDLGAVAVYDDPARLPPTDVQCLCTKTTSNDRLGALLLPSLGPASVVLVMQNGIGVDEQVCAMCPDHPVIGVACFLCAHKAGPAHIVHEDYGRIEIAAANPAAQAWLAPIASDFRAAGIAVDGVDSLSELRWRKLVWNIPFNGLCTVLDASTRELLAEPATTALCRQLMGEVVQAAAACGAPMPADICDKMLAATRQMTPYAPSMQLDWRSGRRLEVETMYAEPLRRAAAAGVAMPAVACLAAQLTVIDRRLAERAREQP